MGGLGRGAVAVGVIKELGVRRGVMRFALFWFVVFLVVFVLCGLRLGLVALSLFSLFLFFGFGRGAARRGGGGVGVGVVATRGSRTSSSATNALPNQHPSHHASAHRRGGEVEVM